jgi:Zn-finger nucleic acid-binding protein
MASLSLEGEPGLEDWGPCRSLQRNKSPRPLQPRDEGRFHFFSRPMVEIDSCSHCDGLWLDDLETSISLLAKLDERRLMARSRANQRVLLRSISSTNGPNQN